MFLDYIEPGNGFRMFSSGHIFLAPLLVFLGFFIFFFKKIFFFIRKRFFIIITLFFVITAAGIGYMAMNKNKSPFHSKIILLGLDGLSPHILEAMMAQGRLPSFSSLEKKGSYRRLATTNPAQSPVAWSGFITGQNPGKHGIYDFVVRNPKTYQ